jgi:peptidoglycan/xylan/chitin deacetylase (PgdA/CDA1 family)
MRVETADPIVGLTYDDGPDPEQTVAVLDVLAERRQRVTFFVLTDRARQHPEIVRRMLDDGHEVGLHGQDHTELSTLPGREAYRRVRDGKRILERITHRPVTLFRPTYGLIPLLPLLGVRLAGMDVVIWTAWARDWTDAPADELAGRVVKALHPGAIVLLHDATDDAQALDAGPRPAFSRAEVTGLVLDGMSEAGYASAPVGELLRRYPAVRALTVERPQLPKPPFRRS